MIEKPHWNQTHGGSRTRLFNIWTGLAYRRYGTYIPKVCAQWNDFAVFREWALAHGYDDNLTIDRLNSRGDYEPSNCRWITRAENAYRARKLLDDRHEKQLIDEWRNSLLTQRQLAQRYGVSRNTIQRAFKRFKTKANDREINQNSGRITRSQNAS